MKVWGQKRRENNLQYKSEEQERKQKRSRAQNRQGRRRNKKNITVSEAIKKKKSQNILDDYRRESKEKGGFLGKRNKFHKYINCGSMTLHFLKYIGSFSM